MNASPDWRERLDALRLTPPAKPRPKPPRCSRCGDSGIVEADEVTDDGRHTTRAYRCGCSAGSEHAVGLPLHPEEPF